MLRPLTIDPATGLAGPASVNGHPLTLPAGARLTDFNSLGDARWSLLAHTHTFASLTGKPTTIVGYGLAANFYLLGDDRWAQAAHNHASVYQPLDEDLSALAELATASFGRDLLIKTDAASVRAYLGAGTSSFDGVFASLTGKPTTINGYGITNFNYSGDLRWVQLADLNPLGDARWSLLAHTHAFADLTAKPTTIAGYGITDFNSLGDARWVQLANLNALGDARWVQLANLNALGDARWSLLAHTHTFASLTGKPTTIAGYGITDFNSLGDARWSLLAHTHAFADLTGKPTTLAGYGITDFNSLGDARWSLLAHTHTGVYQPADADLDTWATKTPYAGALTITAAKTFNVTNTLTLSGTDGATLGIGAGGTLGSNAYTSTAYAPLASPTFTGAPAMPVLYLTASNNTIDMTSVTGNAVIKGGAGGVYFNNNASNATNIGWTDAGVITTRSTFISGGVIRLKSYTVATLPAGTLGDEACVTDALAPTYGTTVVGGGAVKCPVFYNGSAWVSH